MILLQLSAGQGPQECALAVARALGRLLQEAENAGVAVTLLEEVPGPAPGTLSSVLLGLEGASSPWLAEQWSGSLQWICPSPYRPGHRRKNWFFAGAHWVPPAEPPASEIRFETLRASGPGGQHVNKTDSAVRATHLATGVSVRVQSERSQHANRRLALLLIARRLAEREAEAQAVSKAQRWQQHHRLQRGNARRTFRGEGFEPV